MYRIHVDNVEKNLLNRKSQPSRVMLDTTLNHSGFCLFVYVVAVQHKQFFSFRKERERERNKTFINNNKLIYGTLFLSRLQSASSDYKRQKVVKG